ncbi:carbohydrate ABC transporter permease [Paenibacillus ginsengihumi]|uniref:carbohydrate ABC transporter permease n=1 Tax=Paenibacillus ginsengihumi TaxID=431596 RepID=UPI00037633B0|nr:sugar ABC transporter permease [Paenibacillus ginsengihumi]
MQYSWFNRNLRWIYVLPALLFVLLMMVVPVLYTVRLSLFEWSMSAVSPPVFVGFANYAALFRDQRFWDATVNTFYFTIVALAIEVALGLAVALLLNRKFKGKNIAKTVMLLPMVATPVAMGMVWMLMYEPSIGAANMLLKAIGLEPQLFLASMTQVIPSLILVDVWQWTPMVSLILLAGLSTLPTDPYESADVDGANAWQKFIHITLPLLMPTIIIATMLRLIDVLKTYDIIYATTQGGPNLKSETLNIYGYVLGFQYFKFGYASALLVVFFLIVLALTLLLIMFRNRTRDAL